MQLARRDVLGLFGAAAAAAFVPGKSATSAALDEVRIAGGVQFIDGKLTLSQYAAIMEQQGWLTGELAKRGRKIVWYPATHAAVGPIINEAFASNAIDFAGYGDLPSLILNASGIATQIVAPHGAGTSGDTALIVPANSSAQSIEDLKGKRLAIHRGRPWEIPLARLIQSKNLTYADFQIYNINPQIGVSALTSGGIDALYSVGMDGYALEERGLGKIIWSTRQAPPDWNMRTELWGARRFVEQHPDLTQLVVSAHVRAAQWMSDVRNRAAGTRLFQRPDYSDYVVQRVYAGDETTWRQRFSPVFNDIVTNHYRAAAAFALEQKLIGHPVDVDALIEPRFVNAALEELHLENFWS